MYLVTKKNPFINSLLLTALDPPHKTKPQTGKLTRFTSQINLDSQTPFTRFPSLFLDVGIICFVFLSLNLTKMRLTF